jgi:hypothetical protein
LAFPKPESAERRARRVMKIVCDDGAREARRTAPVPASRLRPVEWAAFGETFVTLLVIMDPAGMSADAKERSTERNRLA